jgi:hypothetical protein
VGDSDDFVTFRKSVIVGIETESVEDNVDIFPFAAGPHADTRVGAMRRFVVFVVFFSNIELLPVDIAGHSVATLVRIGSVEGNMDIFPLTVPLEVSGRPRTTFVFGFLRVTNALMGSADDGLEREGNSSSYPGSAAALVDSKNGRHASRIPFKIENDTPTRRAQRRFSRG